MMLMVAPKRQGHYLRYDILSEEHGVNCEFKAAGCSGKSMCILKASVCSNSFSSRMSILGYWAHYELL